MAPPGDGQTFASPLTSSPVLRSLGVVSRSIALVVFIALACLGVCNGVYLTLVHVDYEVGLNSVSSVCHALTSAGCSVTAGRFGAVGPIPVATIGFAGALSMGLLGIAALRRRRLPRDPLRSMLLALAVVSVVISIVMASLSALEGSFCPFCLAWYAVNLGLALAAWGFRDRIPWSEMLGDITGGAAFAAASLFVAGGVAGFIVHEQRRETLSALRNQDLTERA